MAHLWALTGIEPTDPTHLYVYAEDSGLITELRQPDYRASDVTIKNLLFGWEEYIPVGSPDPLKDIEQFQEYIATTYGTQTYMLRPIW